ncbi:MAG: carboxypeptidase regulatory-like domain-containing protein [Terracidiphilus sp.]
MTLALSLLALTGFVAGITAPVAYAQSLISGDIAGTVLDPSGAAIPGAKVTATSNATRATSSATTTGTGAYRFALLPPGTYTVSASAPGFRTASTTVKVGIGQVVMQNLSLSLGATSQTVEVTAAAQLLQTENAQMTTEVNQEQLETIPNPGSDITYAAQAKPGIVMNTGADSSSGTLGYGNFSAFGLPGTSNNFTVNGMQVNDPFLNLNNSGPSNLLLGLNDIQETDVITNAYDVAYGSFGGVQLNSITRSGSDSFHGNANWGWNGDSANANNWFNKNPEYNATPTARPFSNFNQWAAALGGPIKRGKAFFFVNTEGISFITSSQNVVYLPTTAWEQSVVGKDGNCDDSSSSLFNNGYGSGATDECAFYNKIFKLYNGTPNYANAVPTANDLQGAEQLSIPSKLNLTEKLVTARFDMNITPNDKFFAHFEWDHGVQPTYTDPINSAFDASSDQPDYEGQLDWTHVFGSHAVNQFLATGSYYSALFLYTNPQLALSTFPFEMAWYDGFASTLNNDATAWPEGRNVTQYQIADDFSYSAGRHTVKAGFAFKKDDISDFDTGELTNPLVYVDSGNFPTGISDLGAQNFPTNLDLPLSLYTLGLYFEDIYKPAPNVTLTAGIRIERNSDPSCGNNCLSNFGGNFFDLAATSPLDSASAPYNQQIKYNLPQAFPSYQKAMVEPRFGFTWSPGSGKTVLRGGFGFFTDVFPGTIADTMLDNPPLTTSFTVYGTPTPFNGTYTMPVDPSIAQSAQSLMSGANATFQNCTISGAPNPACFASGGSYKAMVAANSAFAAPSFTTTSGRIQYPTYEEWNLQLQRQFTHFDSIQVGYVGNHGYFEPNENVGVNSYLSSGTAAYGLPGAAPAPSFGPVNEIESEARSNYNGLIVSYLHQGQGLNTQVNYSWSHALDEISNGGILPFNAASIETQMNPHNLRQNYGNADYDVRQSLSANFLYQMPYYGGPRVLTDGWQLAGMLFYNSGSPFTPVAYVSDFGITNYGNGSNVVAIAPAPDTPHHCGPSATTTPCLTDADFPNYTSASPFGQYDRNQFWGPHYFDLDLTLIKAFSLPHLGQATKFEPGITAFNVLNHPNFGLPGANINVPSSFGKSTYAEGPPTSIYGSGLGGDPSVRILEFTAKLLF